MLKSISLVKIRFNKYLKTSNQQKPQYGQFNLAWFYESGYGVNIDLEKAKCWYKKAAMQNHDLAIKKCKEMGIVL